MQPIYITMLGEFSLMAGDKRISDSQRRSKKVWLMLACLLCRRDRAVSQKKLIDLLYGENSESSNPENALRITLHRLRALLDELWPGAGMELVLSGDGAYSWNWEHETRIDYELFEALCEESENVLDARLQALELYKGELLARYSSELWIIPIGAHLHNLFVAASVEAAALLSAGGRHKEAADCCRRAIGMEPYNEKLVQILMTELGHMGDSAGAAAAYEALSQRLFNDFGIRPGEETRAVYRTTAYAVKDQSLPMDEVLEHLQEQAYVPGAMQCDYDYFKVLCFAESRAMERSGAATHVALLSIAVDADRKAMDETMERLGEQIRLNLRRGDAFSRCSMSQYIMMLPNANYENSCMVCRRCIAAFQRAHPRSTAKINYMVQPLNPRMNVP